MIKTVVIPQNNLLHLAIPNNYIGKEIEILLYSKDELAEETPQLASNNVARFKGLLTGEEADKYNRYFLNESREGLLQKGLNC